MWSLRGVGLSVGGASLLRDVSLEVEASRLHVLIGPNGAGKSTLLKVLARDLRPSSGEILFQGRDLSSWSGERLALCRGVMPQLSSLSFPFSVREVVLMGRIPHRKQSSRARDLEVVEASLGRVGLLEMVDRSYTTLSGGERQRVHFARVLAQVEGMKGGCLLLDEPVASLDPAHALLLMRVVGEFVEGGGTALVVLHDLNLASLCADRLMVLKGGALVASGAPGEVLRAELLEEFFEMKAHLVPHPETGRPMLLPQLAQDVSTR